MQCPRIVNPETHNRLLPRILAVATALPLATLALSLAEGAQVRQRTGQEVVNSACVACHEKGVNGAPKIGDRAAWIPRMSKGLDVLVQSAVHGHGAMPARGGMADLSDREIESAITYMFNYGVVTLPPPPARAAADTDPFHKAIAGADIYLGIVKAESMPAAQRPASVASGKGYYHVNISLIDSATKSPIKEAHVRVRVADAIGVETKTMEAMSANDSTSYGGYFRMAANNTYTITALIERPGAVGVTEAQFVYKAW
ncbi:MAG TPA: c-type cytochrome [Burkholderiaceae bacterium]|nr:c-type cytochrome [Burkholderiaceae bacterium]